MAQQAAEPKVSVLTGHACSKAHVESRARRWMAPAKGQQEDEASRWRVVADPVSLAGSLCCSSARSGTTYLVKPAPEPLCPLMQEIGYDACKRALSWGASNSVVSIVDPALYNTTTQSDRWQARFVGRWKRACANGDVRTGLSIVMPGVAGCLQGEATEATLIGFLTTAPDGAPAAAGGTLLRSP